MIIEIKLGSQSGDAVDDNLFSSDDQYKQMQNIELFKMSYQKLERIYKYQETCELFKIGAILKFECLNFFSNKPIELIIKPCLFKF